jgi:pimeloyl-ACP methyl ester carboxylesterase
MWLSRVAGVVVLIVCVAFVLWGTLPRKTLREAHTPVHWVLYREPNLSYTEELVSFRVRHHTNRGSSNDTDSMLDSTPDSIPCFYHRADPDERASLCVLYSHGNAENLLTCVTLLRTISSALHVDVVGWDYSGYGQHTFDATHRTATGITADLTAVYEYLRGTLGYASHQILLWGYSLGTGPTLQLAATLCDAQTPPRGVILFGAYASIREVVRSHSTRWLASWIDPRWDSVAAIGRVQAPILSFHAQHDKLIPLSHARMLQQAQPRMTERIVPYAGHTTFPWTECLATIRPWLATSNGV